MQLCAFVQMPRPVVPGLSTGFVGQGVLPTPEGATAATSMAGRQGGQTGQVVCRCAHPNNSNTDRRMQRRKRRESSETARPAFLLRIFSRQASESHVYRTFSLVRMFQRATRTNYDSAESLRFC